MARAAYASWYYILSSLPVNYEPLFTGLSPCGLSHSASQVCGVVVVVVIVVVAAAAAAAVQTVAVSATAAALLGTIDFYLLLNVTVASKISLYFDDFI